MFIFSFVAVFLCMNYKSVYKSREFWLNKWMLGDLNISIFDLHKVDDLHSQKQQMGGGVKIRKYCTICSGSTLEKGDIDTER